MADNTVTLVGNLTRAPELRFSGGGTPIAGFGIAVNSRKKGANGEYVDDPKFFDCTAFKSLAENIAESLNKGDRVVISGRLDFRQWQNQEGENRSKVEVLVDEIGPSLRWATAQVIRNERRGGGAQPAYEDEAPF